VTTDNPYSPPEADVGDPSPAPVLGTRPWQIVQAIALLWVSSALGLCASLSEAGESGPTLVVVVLVTLAVTAVLSVPLWRGRNWARVLYVVLVATSFAEFVAAWGVAERPALAVALEAVSFVADGGSFFLLFTPPGSLWFRSTRQQPDFPKPEA
jgi:hypothetical protein